jgi:MinD superfamily P-loop ATPase|nr:ATP-binding protein [Candidatus Krumholzibacteria bacterium]
MILTIASGKGGTGKTTVAVNLARLACERGMHVHFCDCDVEEPNAHLFLHPDLTMRRTVQLPLPVVDQDECDHCGACADICQFNAIAALPRQTVVFPELCHSCSGCWLVCPRQAIDQGLRTLGVVESGHSSSLAFTRGLLEVGETQVPPVIEAVKETPGAVDLVIRDAPPGATCPTVASLSGSDFVLLVTEPTPFGLHDLKVAITLVRDLGLPFAVTINRDGSGDDRVRDYCRDENVKLLPGLPFSRDAAELISRGQLLIDHAPDLRHALDQLLDAVLANQEVKSS